MNITIEKASPDRWHEYRDIRLLALTSDPLAFASTYEEELLLTEANWRQRIGNMFFALDNANIVGLVGLVRQENFASFHSGHIVSLWVKPEYRGAKIAKNLVGHIQELAPKLALRKLFLEVTTSQTAAINLYENLGFIKIGVLKDNIRKGDRYLDEFLMEWYATI